MQPYGEHSNVSTFLGEMMDEELVTSASLGGYRSFTSFSSELQLQNVHVWTILLAAKVDRQELFFLGVSLTVMLCMNVQ